MNPWELHPALVHFPLALLLSSTALEVVARRWSRRDLALVAVGLLVAGLLSAVVAAFAGVVAYFTVPPHSDAANDRILLHGLSALGAASFYSLTLFLRWRDRHRVGSDLAIATSIVGATLLFITGALGGRLVYHDRVGVTDSRHSATPSAHRPARE